VHFIVQLANGDSFNVGDFDINENGSLDVWATRSKTPEEWWGLYAAHAWHSVLPDEVGSGDVVPFPEREAEE
jgi:hypothetical protein